MPEFQLAERMNHIDTSQIRKMFDLAGKLKNPINLSIGQPHFATPAPIIEEMEKALREGKTSYTLTQGILPLRERISRKFKEQNGFHASPDNILVSSGVASLLQLLFQAVVEPGDRCLLLDPYFLIYKSMLDFMGAKIETLPENFTPDQAAAIDPAGLKLIMYSSPSNPSGYVVREDQIRALGNLADKSGALLASDEIYEIFDYDGDFRGAASIYPDALVMMGFSKTYNMTGLRLAAATGPRKVISAMTTLQQYTVVCAPAPVQWAGIRALDLDMSEYVNEYNRNRDYCMERLGQRVSFSRPGGAFYIFPELPADIVESDSEFAERAIREKELLLVPGNIFSPSRRHLRISYAATRETLERGMDALTDLLGA